MDLQCNTWPNVPNYGCKGGGDWKLLDRATFGTAECEYLCLQNALGEGCCFLSERYSECYWKAEATVAYHPQVNSLAVACNFAPKG